MGKSNEWKAVHRNQFWRYHSALQSNFVELHKNVPQIYRILRKIASLTSIVILNASQNEEKSTQSNRNFEKHTKIIYVGSYFLKKSIQYDTTRI